MPQHTRAIARAHGDVRSAALAVSVADAARAQLGVEPWPTVQSFIDRTRRDIRGDLGAVEFEAILRDSRNLDLFETVDRVVVAVAP